MTTIRCLHLPFCCVPFQEMGWFVAQISDVYICHFVVSHSKRWDGSLHKYPMSTFAILLYPIPRDGMVRCTNIRCLHLPFCCIPFQEMGWFVAQISDVYICHFVVSHSKRWDGSLHKYPMSTFAILLCPIPRDGMVRCTNIRCLHLPFCCIPFQEMGWFVAQISDVYICHFVVSHSKRWDGSLHKYLMSTFAILLCPIPRDGMVRCTNIRCLHLPFCCIPFQEMGWFVAQISDVYICHFVVSHSKRWDGSLHKYLMSTFAILLYPIPRDGMVRGTNIRCLHLPFCCVPFQEMGWFGAQISDVYICHFVVSHSKRWDGLVYNLRTKNVTTDPKYISIFVHLHG